MTTTAVVPRGDRALKTVPPPDAAAIDTALANGDLSKLTAEQRVFHYVGLCERLGLDPMTEPFCYVTLSGKLTLYARRQASDQLRKLHQVSISIEKEEERDGLMIVQVKATTPDGRVDYDLGVVPLTSQKVVGGKVELVPLPPMDAANARMKCYTKAKRRVTLSICGLGMLDETELETVSYRREVPRVQAELKRLLKKPAELEADDLQDPTSVDAQIIINEPQYQRLVAVTTRYGVDLGNLRARFGTTDLRAITVDQFKVYLRTLVAAHEHETN